MLVYVTTLLSIGAEKSKALKAAAKAMEDAATKAQAAIGQVREKRKAQSRCVCMFVCVR